jgi:predicted outer membrane repeat protein
MEAEGPEVSVRLYPLLALALLSCKNGDETDTGGDCSTDTFFADSDGDGYGDAADTTDACAGEAPQGYVDNDLDCDDADAAVSPDGAETCNGADDDCDGQPDDGIAVPTWFTDADLDGFGDPSTGVQACEAPSGAVDNGDDCDDTSASFHPGAVEDDCTDPNDYNCDGSVGYADADTDGFAACLDCDDSSAAVNPDAIEVCNDVDDDCDSEIDVGATDAKTWYADGDDDAYGDAAQAIITDCDQPSGYVEASGDCDDANVAYNPAAPETDCTDPADYNCDGSVGYADVDGDGHAACVDCDDNAAAVNTDATEVCNDIDDDCNGTIDDDYATDVSTWFYDSDSDGYGDSAITDVDCDQPAGYVSLADDCDDVNPVYYPGAPETDCADPNDYNCDGSTGYVNADGDAFAACEECDDNEADVYPGATEYCNTVDDDCDGTLDEDDSADAQDWYADADGDGYGDPATMVHQCYAPSGYVGNADDCDDTDETLNPDTPWYADGDSDSFGDAGDVINQCEQPTGYVRSDTDCDDSTSAVSPVATETCNMVDDDCDGTTDEDDAMGAPTWYADGDSDGFGDAASPDVACYVPTGFVSDSTDCDDGTATTYPGADETCNLEDDDCNGTVDDDYATDALTWYEDVDGDLYGNAEVTDMACEAPTGFVADDTDCDDTRDDVSPAGTEICDAEDVDEDCDGTSDDADSAAGGKVAWYEDADGDGHAGSSSAMQCDASATYAYTATSDCNDGATYIYVGAPETCDGDDTDEDCDGLAEDSDSDSTGKTSFYTDADSDGFGGSGSASLCDASTAYPLTSSTDCNDSASAINPAATEICDASNTDEDCDGSADDADSSVSSGTYSTFYRDSDSDGYAGATSNAQCDADTTYAYTASTDCNDSASAINPAAAEICDSANTDEDCDGSADDSDASVSAASFGTFYSDGDSDGYAGSTSNAQCDADTTYAYTASTDCNDSVSAVNPGATEICDASNTDEDCDGSADDLDASVSTGTMTSWYPDADGDNYGTGTAASYCDAPTGYGAAGDCDDTDVYVYPGAAELCDGQYNDCSTSGTWTADSEDGKVSVATTAGVWTDKTSSFSGSASSPITYIPTSNTATYFCDGTYYAKVAIASSSSNVALVGRNGRANTTLSAGGASSAGSVVTVGSSSTNIGLQGLTITGGSTTTGGGMLLAASSTIGIDSVEFLSNSGTTNGGAIYLSQSTGGTTVTIKDSKFTSNKAGSTSGSGGAIYMVGSSTYPNSLSITDTDFTSNQTGPTATNGYAGSGGALYSSYTTTTVSGGTWDGNKSGTGGALYFSSQAANYTISGATFKNNKSLTNGGVTYQSHSGRTGTYSSCTFTSNQSGISGTSSGNGGALYNFFGTLAVTGSTFTGNASVGTTSGTPAGGAIYAWDTTSLSSVTMSSNSAKNGAALYVPSSYTTTISSSTFSSNTASQYGGAIYVAGTISDSGSTISGNTALSGGGIYQSGTSSKATLSGTKVTGNSATTSVTTSNPQGGGWYIDGSGATGSMTTSASVSNNTVSHTSSTSGNSFGGGIAILSGAKVTCDSSTVNGNAASVAGATATAKGGGVYMNVPSSTSATNTFTATTCDLGTSATTADNTPEDILINTTPTTTAYSYGTSASFTCTVTSLGGSCI